MRQSQQIHLPKFADLNKLKDYSLAIQRINCETHNNPWDGLKSRTTGYISIDLMEDIIAENGITVLACEAMIAAARDAGSKDDISIVIGEI